MYNPRPHTNLLTMQLPIEGRTDIVDTLVAYQTDRGTHLLWMHHGVPVEAADLIVNAHPLGAAIWAAIKESADFDPPISELTTRPMRSQRL